MNNLPVQLAPDHHDRHGESEDRQGQEGVENVLSQHN